MNRRLFSHDPETGLTRYFHPSADGKTFGMETEVDVESVLEDNKRRFMGESSKGRRWQGDLIEVANIPLHIWMDLDERGILQDQKKLRAWLNDPANMYFRVKGGRV
jgi:hypothetical protein